jgi:hypothetical protein
MKHASISAFWGSFIACLLIWPLMPLPTAQSHPGTAVPIIGIRINGGARYTNNRTVEIEVKSLRTADQLILEMQAGTDPELNGADWRPYSTGKFNLTLPAGDGEKQVYVRLKDKAGNLSPIESSAILLDTQAPVPGSLVINEEEPFTNDKLGRVLLVLRAEGADLVMLSNHQDFRMAVWEKYEPTRKWIVELPGDGEKTVWVKYKDHAGNETAPVKASIRLDTTPPQGGSVSINDGARYTRDRKVTVKVTAGEVARIRVIGNTAADNYDFMPDASGTMTIPWMLDSMDGPKYVRVFFMDEARNRTSTPVEAGIILKRTPPAPPQVLINQGNKFTNHSKGLVDLALSARENPQLLQMQVSNNPDFRDVQPQKFTALLRGWLLPAEEDGVKSVYARVIDEAGNFSQTATADIILDRTPPTIAAFRINDSSEWCNSLKVKLLCSVADAVQMQISNTPTFTANLPWENFREERPDWTLPGGDGLKTVYARFKDRAENISATSSASIRLDTKPPAGKLSINGGATHVSHISGLVNLEIEYDEDAVSMEISNIPAFHNAEPVPVVQSLSGWELEGEDGPKNVFLRLQDRAGNYSKVLSAGIILDRQAPAQADFSINNNQEWLNNRNRKVVLSLRAEGVTHMMVSNRSDFSGAEWVPFVNAASWTLEGEEGIHYIYVKYRDAAGNESEVMTRSIKSDFTPPRIRKLAINGGDEYTNDAQKNVAIDMEVDDAVAMLISNVVIKDTALVRNAWEPYQSAKAWTLEGEDGLKTVYALFRDQAGNISAEVYDRITLDRVPPKDGRISINKGAKWFNEPSGKCTLQLGAQGADEVRLGNLPDLSQAAWEPLIAERENWILDLNQSIATVYAQFRDKAGNVSETTSASIQVDLVPPHNAGVRINEGQKFTNARERKITLTLSAEQASSMRISRFEHFRDSRWEPYATTREISLPEQDGQKTFFVQFADEAGNVSETVSASILLDTTPPELTHFRIDDGAEWTNHPEKQVTLKIEAKDAAEMMVSDKADMSGASWQAYRNAITGYVLPGEDGEKSVYLKLRDEVGNESQVYSAKINLKRSF